MQNHLEAKTTGLYAGPCLCSTHCSTPMASCAYQGGIPTCRRAAHAALCDDEHQRVWRCMPPAWQKSISPEQLRAAIDAVDAYRSATSSAREALREALDQFEGAPNTSETRSAIVDAITACHTGSVLADADLDLIRQWFDAVQDLNPAYLTPADYELAQRVYEALGLRVPNSIATKGGSSNA